MKNSPPILTCTCSVPTLRQVVIVKFLKVPFQSFVYAYTCDKYRYLSFFIIKLALYYTPQSVFFLKLSHVALRSFHNYVEYLFILFLQLHSILLFYRNDSAGPLLVDVSVVSSISLLQCVMTYLIFISVSHLCNNICRINPNGILNILIFFLRNRLLILLKDLTKIDANPFSLLKLGHVESKVFCPFYKCLAKDCILLFYSCSRECGPLGRTPGWARVSFCIPQPRFLFRELLLQTGALLLHVSLNYHFIV